MPNYSYIKKNGTEYCISTINDFLVSNIDASNFKVINNLNYQSVPVTYMNYSSSDPWTESVDLSVIKENGTSVANAVDHATMPLFYSIYFQAFSESGTDGDSYKYNCSTVTIQKTSNSITITGSPRYSGTAVTKTYYDADFRGSALPKKLILIIQAAGGGGAGVINNRIAGGGGGSGSFGVIVVPLTDTITINVGKGGSGGLSYYEIEDCPGSAGTATTVKLGSTTIATFPAGGGGGYPSTEYTTGYGGAAGAMGGSPTVSSPAYAIFTRTGAAGGVGGGYSAKVTVRPRYYNGVGNSANSSETKISCTNRYSVADYDSSSDNEIVRIYPVTSTGSSTRNMSVGGGGASSTRADSTSNTAYSSGAWNRDHSYTGSGGCAVTAAAYSSVVHQGQAGGGARIEIWF